MRPPRLWVLIVASALLVSSYVTAHGQAPATIDWAALTAEAVTLLREYLRIDTTNPPGRETAGAEFLAGVLRREGIPAEVIELEAGRGNVYARLKGDGSRKALVLLNHIDVVPAERKLWTVDPFGAELKDDHVWGRGALDMKGVAIVQLMTILVLSRHRAPLKGDVVFLATADEESGGGAGVERLLESRRELVENVDTVLTEGPFIEVTESGRAIYNVGIAEKIPAWIRLTARGRPGHGSRPGPDDAPHRLVLAVGRLLQHKFPVRIAPEVQQYLAAIAPTEDSPWRERLSDITKALRDKDVRSAFARTFPGLNALTTTTLALTVLEGSLKTNVIPSEARAEIDLRFVPGTDLVRAIEDIRLIMNDAEISVEPIIRPVEAGGSPVAHRIFDVIRSVAESTAPGALVVPSVQSGFTDCRHFRARKVPCYGLHPFRSSDAAPPQGIHGHDERVSLADITYALKIVHDIVRKMATD